MERDLDLGFISCRTAEEVYGVVIASETPVADRKRYRLDQEANARRRAERRGDKTPSDTGFR